MNVIINLINYIRLVRKPSFLRRQESRGVGLTFYIVIPAFAGMTILEFLNKSSISAVCPPLLQTDCRDSQNGGYCTDG